MGPVRAHSPWAQTLGAPLLLGAILCLAFSGVLVGGRTLSVAAWVPGVLPSGPVGATRPTQHAPLRDVEGAAWVDEPAPYLVHRALTEGSLPLWNDAEGLGIPLLGNPNMGALAPLQLAVNLAPSPLVQDLTWLARAYLLGLFTYLLARGLDCGSLGALGAGVAVMLSGQTVEWIAHHPLNTDVFVPLALLAALRVADGGRLATAGLALAVGAGLLGLKPQSALMAGGFGAFWLVAATFDRRTSLDGPRLARSLAGWIGGVALGIGLASVALIPFADSYEAASGLVRAGRSAQSEWALPLASLPSLAGPLAAGLMPADLGAPDAGQGAVGLPYAGVSVIALALMGAWRRRRRWLTWALLATIVLELARIFGGLPVSLAGVPLLGAVNFVKYCFPLYLALALLVGFAFDGQRSAVKILGLLLLVGELLWIVPRVWAERSDPWAPAPWVDALRSLAGEHPGRISGPVDLAPPLVSSALGFRDLRSIDVLTPRPTYDFVSRLVAPSQGVTWVLADPDPLLAATGPGGSVANLRWVLARQPLEARALSGAVRSLVAHLRLTRLLDDLEDLSIDTRRLSGGLHEAGEERRFHWVCETPCRFRFALSRMPEHFVAGISSPREEKLRLALQADGTRPGPARVNDTLLDSTPSRWSDIRVRTAGLGPGTITLEIASDAPTTVFVGGVGPSPSPEAEKELFDAELRHRTEALSRLELRYADQVAHIYENPGALGAAFLAERVEVRDDRDSVFECLREHAGVPVACLRRADLGAGAVPAASRGDVRVREDASNRASFEVEAAEAGLLVVSRLGDAGWRADLDGEDVDVLRANEAMMAIRVPPGAHRVDLRYAPASVMRGGAVSLGALAVLLALLIPGRRRGRSFEPGPAFAAGRDAGEPRASAGLGYSPRLLPEHVCFSAEGSKVTHYPELAEFQVRGAN